MHWREIERMRMNRIAPVLIALMLLAGCARARWTPPSIEVPPRWSAPVVNQAATEQARAAWWMNFNDPQLNALIDEALKANNDLAVAVIRVQRARLQAGLANTTLTPDVKGVGLNTSSRNLGSHNTKRSANVSGSLSYELDLWGKLAQQRAGGAESDWHHRGVVLEAGPFKRADHRWQRGSEASPKNTRARQCTVCGGRDLRTGSGTGRAECLGATPGANPAVSATHRSAPCAGSVIEPPALIRF